MKLSLATATIAASLLLVPTTASAGSKVKIGLGADLSSPWTLQLKPKKRYKVRTRHKTARRAFSLRNPLSAPSRNERLRRKAAMRSNALAARDTTSTGSVRSQTGLRTSITPNFNPNLLPTIVDYHGTDKPGTIVVDTPARRLFLVMPGGKARRYAVGVGKPGFEWAGTHKVTRKAEWPSWRPPAEMIAREKKKGRTLPTFMEGGVNNPLGARALYLGSTIYRIHGTNQAWSIGKAVSSGCIRMRNEDVMDLYDRVPKGTKVRVI